MGDDNMQAEGALATVGSEGDQWDEDHWWKREEEARASSARPGRDLRSAVWPLGSVAVALLAGMGLRQIVPHPAVAAIAVTCCLVLAGLTGPVLARMQARVLAKAGQPAIPPPGWVAEADSYSRWLSRRTPPVPAENLAAIEQYLARIAGNGWQSAHLFIARATPDIPAGMGVTHLLADRVQIVLGSHILEGRADVAAATLAHESRHTSTWQTALEGLLASRMRFIFVAGWALARPAALWAALAVQVAFVLLRWLREEAADLGAAADVGPDAMRAVFDVMQDTAAARRRADRSPALVRVAGRALYWIYPYHLPIPARRAIIASRHWRHKAPVTTGADA